MATVEPKFSGVAPDQPQGAYYTVSIAQAGFSDAETTAGGRVSPCGASDFATKPTTLAHTLAPASKPYTKKLDPETPH